MPHTEKAYLSDINSHLVLTYLMIRDDVSAVISQLVYHKKHHSAEYYAQARETLARAENPVEVASLFIYLNKTCYNGLYRVNKSGKFNVPIGRYKNPNIVDADNLRLCSEFLTHADISRQNFALINPHKDDFIYFDPPYHEAFSAYDGSGFGNTEHEELAALCRKLDQRGVLFMLSNSDTPFIRQLYSGYTMENVDASRCISSQGNDRKKESELIIRNYVR